jgi:5-methylcytosine-specific restriction protein A
MTRRKRTALQRSKLFLEHKGICHLCGNKIQNNERWDLDHVIALELTRDDSDQNLRPAHVNCHKLKTKGDFKSISKAKRIEAKHLGARPPSKWPSRKFKQDYISNTKYIGRDGDT